MKTTSKVHGELMAAGKAKRAARAERTEPRPALAKAYQALRALNEATGLMREAADQATNGPRTSDEHGYSGALDRWADQLESIREMVATSLNAISNPE